MPNYLAKPAASPVDGGSSAAAVVVEPAEEEGELFAAMFQAGVRLETTGDVIMAGSDRSHASVTQRYHYSTRGLKVVEDGISHYTFAEINDELKITQHMWWRPRGTNAPSMRWVIEDFSP